MAVFIAIAVLMTLAVIAALLIPLLKKDAGTASGSTADLSVRVLREQLAELGKERDAGLLDKDIFNQEKAELEQRALEDGKLAGATQVRAGPRRPALAVALGLAVPLLAIVFYLIVGTPAGLNPERAAAAQGEHELGPQQLEGMAATLAQRLATKPDDGEGWMMLGRTYTVLERYSEAAQA